MSERKRPPKDWEGAVDKTIREALERGDFDNLAGRGKPLDLSDNPFAPEDMRLAYKLLRDAGASLDWIEDGKEILAEREKLAALLEREARSQRERRRNQSSLAPDRIIAEYRRQVDRREWTVTEYRDRARVLNRKIDEYNLKVPSSRLQQRRLTVEQEIERFLDECQQK